MEGCLSQAQNDHPPLNPLFPRTSHYERIKISVSHFPLKLKSHSLLHILHLPLCDPPVGSAPQFEKHWDEIRGCSKAKYRIEKVFFFNHAAPLECIQSIKNMAETVHL